MVETERPRPQRVRVNFAPSLVPLVTSGEKTVTWRVGDEKQIAVGDTLLLHRKGTLPNGSKVNDEAPFGRATVVTVIEKPFSELTEEDMQGHDGFADRAEMIRTFQGYYPDKGVTLATPVKIIRFELQNA